LLQIFDVDLKKAVNSLFVVRVPFYPLSQDECCPNGISALVEGASSIHERHGYSVEYVMVIDRWERLLLNVEWHVPR